MPTGLEAQPARLAAHPGAVVARRVVWMYKLLSIAMPSGLAGPLRQRLRRLAPVYGAALAFMAAGCGGIPPQPQVQGAVVVFAAFEGPEADAPTIRSVAVVIVGGVRGEFNGPAERELVLRNIPFGDQDPPRQPLTVTAPGYRTVSQQLTLRRDMATFVEVNMERVDLTQTGTVSGLVRASGGGPLVNALVTFTWQEDGTSRSVSGFTDNQGRFIVGGIRAGPVIAEAAAAGYLSQAQEVSIAPDQGGAPNPDLAFALISGQSTVTVRGTVKDLRTEAPLALARVTIGDNPPQVTGEDGTFEVPDVLVGQRTITVKLTGYEDYTATIMVLPGMAPVVVLMARLATEPPGTPYTVAGTVTLLGRPDNSGALVTAFDRDRLMEIARATTDAAGRYYLFLPQGRYELEVSFGGKRIRRLLEYPGGGRILDGIDFTLSVGP